MRRDQAHRDQPSLFGLPSLGETQTQSGSNLPMGEASQPAATPLVSVARSLTRASHPETSFEAAVKLLKSGRRWLNAMKLLNQVNANPGRTRCELDEIQGTKKNELGKRAGDLKKLGFVEDGESRFCQSKVNEGMNATCGTLFITAKGEEFLRDEQVRERSESIERIKPSPANV